MSSAKIHSVQHKILIVCHTFNTVEKSKISFETHRNPLTVISWKIKSSDHIPSTYNDTKYVLLFEKRAQWENTGPKQEWKPVEQTPDSATRCLAV